MKCSMCETEMFIERHEEKIIEKCPNPNCPWFGYKKKEGSDIEKQEK